MKKGNIVVMLSDIESAAARLARCLDFCSVMTFAGPLGAGKTTIIRSLLQEAGVTQAVTSPTFSYLNVYENQQGETFYHFDLYRLSSLDEFLQAGFDEYLYIPGSWALVEWPRIIEPLLTHDVCAVDLAYDSSDRSKRELSWYCM